METMRVPSASRARGIGANMTPMIDVVFLLIIFFLVSSHLARQESRLPLDLPLAGTPMANDPERRALTINVDPQSRIVVRNTAVGDTELRKILADYASAEGREAALRIRVHRFAPYRVVEPVLRTAANLGLTDITLAVQTKDSNAQRGR